MTFYVVRYEHPDAVGWQQQLMPHLDWLRARVADGSVRASGPLPGDEVRSALLIIAATDRAALDAVIASDPYAVHGLIANMTVTEWDPLFGVFAGESTMPRLAGG